jgi:hypothetical protein
MFCVHGLTDAYYFSRHSYSAIWPLRRWIKRLAGCLRMELLKTNDHADLHMRMH